MKNDVVLYQPPSLKPLPSPAPFGAEILAGQLAPSSIGMYRRDFAAYLRFAGSLGEALDAATLARWRAHLANETEMSPNTINRMLSAVKRLIREAATQGYIDHGTAQPFDRITGVKTVALKDRVKATARVRIEPSEMRDLCETPDPERLIGLRDKALLATLASSGLRVSELAGLTVARIRQKGKGYVVLVRGKNDAEYREAHLSREAFAHIQTWLELRNVESEHVFTAFEGRGHRLSSRPLSAVAIWQIIRKYSLENGLADVKPHDFRRFVGTQLARDDIRKAQKALGHKRLETTARHYVLDELEPGLTDDLY